MLSEFIFFSFSSGAEPRVGRKQNTFCSLWYVCLVEAICKNLLESSFIVTMRNGRHFAFNTFKYMCQTSRGLQMIFDINFLFVSLLVEGILINLKLPEPINLNSLLLLYQIFTYMAIRIWLETYILSTYI